MSLIFKVFSFELIIYLELSIHIYYSLQVLVTFTHKFNSMTKIVCSDEHKTSKR